MSERSQRTSLLLVDCATWDAASGRRENAALWTQDGRIRAAGPVEEVRSEIADEGPEPETVSLGGATVLPGLVNLHVHFGLVLPGATGAMLAGETSTQLAYRMAENAAATLRAGVTTVRLLGERDHVDLALKEAVGAGRVPGPRIFAAGQGLCCTGGHGHAGGALEADGVSGFRRATRAQLKAGADLIKVMLTGGIAGEHEGMSGAQLTPDELGAVVEVAHSWGRKVTAHAGPAGAIGEGVAAGLDCVEHGYGISAEAARLMAERDVMLVPTLVVTRAGEFYERIGAPPWMVERALSVGEGHMAGFAAALEAGVKVGLGSDMMPAEPFEGTTGTVREIEFMVEGGMSPEAALEAATLTPVEWLGADASLGTLERGKWADLVAVDGDPAADISTLRALHFVMQAGRVVRDDKGAAA